MDGGRPGSIPLLVFCCAVSVLAVACGGPQAIVKAGGSSSASPSSVTPIGTSPSPNPSPSVGAGSLMYGLASSGDTVTLTLHQKLEIKLPQQQVGPWTPLHDSNPEVLGLVVGPIPPVGSGAPLVGSYIAAAQGTAVVSSTMVPSCLKEKPACALPDRLFELKVVVVD